MIVPRGKPVAEPWMQATQEQIADPSVERRPRVALVEGDRPRLSAEVEHVLRGRLRAAILLMLSGIFLFFLRQIVFEPLFLPLALATLLPYVVTFLALAVILLLLPKPGARSLGRLRAYELIVFGILATFLATLQHVIILQSALEEEPIWTVYNLLVFVAFWYGLMFTYGMFIPSSWQRALAVTSTMAMTPLAVLAIDGLVHSRVAEALSLNTLSMLVLMLGFGAASATYGTYAIGTLRKEAFAAKQLGQYRLKQLLGTGGMGEVYLAEHLLLKRPCAIKVVRPSVAADPKVLARFEREVRATAELTHWNTIEIYDYGRAGDGTFYYVMEYLPGMNLGELVDRHGPISAARAIHLFRQLCAALREAHALGLIHRDIKPANIFVARLGGLHDVIKLLDFGLVKPRDSLVPLNLTQYGTVAGSPLFMSPEQGMANAMPDARSDIYSLGAVAYFAVTGQPPFLGATPMEVLVRHARDPVCPPSELRPEIPGDLEAVILRCLEKEPASRFPDVEALDRALASCRDAGHWTEVEAAHWWASDGEIPDVSQVA